MNKIIVAILIIAIGGFIASTFVTNAITPQLDYSQLQTQEQKQKGVGVVIIVFAPPIILFGIMTYITRRKNET